MGGAPAPPLRTGIQHVPFVRVEDETEIAVGVLCVLINPLLIQLPREYGASHLKQLNARSFNLKNPVNS